MSPRANFVCNAKRCATDEGAPIYELPVGSTRCPVCGSKRLKRVWAGPENAPSINKGIAKFVDSAAEPAYEQATRIIDRGKEVERQAQKAGVPSFAVPVGQVGAALARLGAGPIALPTSGGGSRPVPVTHPVLARIPGQPTLGPGTKRDREFTVVKKRDGTLDGAKA